MTHDERRHEPRHRAREAALQILYQWEVGRVEPDAAIEAYWSGHGSSLAARHRRFANDLARGVVDHLEEVDRLIAETAVHWRLERLAIVDRLVLRLGVFELAHCPETPRNVVINEALELARTFSTDEALKFVNGNLDAIKQRLELPSPPAERGAS